MKSWNEPCAMAEMDESAFITKIQHFSLHDGPGIRTTVFFKGCNLHCAWCHNPETISGKGQVGFDARRCIGCGMCVAACPMHLHDFVKDSCETMGDGGTSGGKTRLDVGGPRHEFLREGCAFCGKCVEICPTGALESYGMHMSLSEIAKACVRDGENFPRFGGVTFSGGECLLQAEKVFALASSMKRAGLHVCIDTALNVSWEVIEKMLPVTDLFLVDVKAGREETHKKYVGASRERVCENLKRLTKVGDCWVRIPVVHGVNDTEEEVAAMANLLGGLGPHLQKIQLLAYHALGEPKYRCLGLGMERFEAPDEGRRDWMQKELEKTGVQAEWN